MLCTPSPGKGDTSPELDFTAAHLSECFSAGILMGFSREPAALNTGGFALGDPAEP